jgi:hypothetical protein
MSGHAAASGVEQIRMSEWAFVFLFTRERWGPLLRSRVRMGVTVS